MFVTDDTFQSLICASKAVAYSIDCGLLEERLHRCLTSYDVAIPSVELSAAGRRREAAHRAVIAAK
jgi:hypothetical protein